MWIITERVVPTRKLQNLVSYFWAELLQDELYVSGGCTTTYKGLKLKYHQTNCSHHEIVHLVYNFMKATICLVIIVTLPFMCLVHLVYNFMEATICLVIIVTLSLMCLREMRGKTERHVCTRYCVYYGGFIYIYTSLAVPLLAREPLWTLSTWTNQSLVIKTRVNRGGCPLVDKITSGLELRHRKPPAMNYHLSRLTLFSIIQEIRLQ